MNQSKSKFDSGPAPASQTREYIILQDARGPAYDMLKVTQTNVLQDVVSADGKVMTVTVNGSDVIVLEKQ